MDIVLASARRKVREHWRQGLEGGGPLVVVDDRSRLERMLQYREARLVLLDLDLPGLDHGTAVAELVRHYPKARFVGLTDIPDDAQGLELLAAGLFGYLNTYVAAPLLAAVIQTVQLDEVWVGKRMSRALLAGQHTDPNGEAALPDQLEPLTERERQIARLLGQGASNRGIAHQLGITERTVKAHLTAIFRKAGVRDRMQLALLVNRQHTGPA